MKMCNVCNQKQEYYFSYKKYKYYKCCSCGLVTTLPLPTKVIIERHYSKRFREGNYSLLLKYEEEYKRVYQDFISILLKILKNKRLKPKNLRVLDVGCFTGSFLQMLKKSGFNVTGLELQKEAVKIARKKLPSDVIVADVMTDKLPGKRYDIICMLGLIEHVNNPSKLIKKCSKYQDDNGMLLIQTPDSSSLPARILRKYWPPYSPVEHIHLFSQQSLIKLLEQNNYEIIFKSKHIKKLPISYVFQMLKNFGPEFRKIFSPIYKILPPSIRNAVLPFYVGEMILVARKLPIK